MPVLIVIVIVIGVTIGVLLPRINPKFAELTGRYHATGTAAETLAKLTVDDHPSTKGYDREKFGYRQTDTDGNGCDVRDDVLARDLKNVTYTKRGGCKVKSGILEDPYTGAEIHFQRGKDTSAAVQIDHVVALQNAWQSGATTCSTSSPWTARRTRRNRRRRRRTGCRRTAHTVASTSHGRSV